MSELNSTNAWPFTEIPAEERLDINAIFGDSTDTANQGNPFEVQATAAAPGTGTCDAGNAGGTRCGSSRTDASCCPAEGSSRSRTAGVKCSRRKPHCRGF